MAQRIYLEHAPAFATLGGDNTWGHLYLVKRDENDAKTKGEVIRGGTEGDNFLNPLETQMLKYKI